jgi:tRNA pseudouridine55 synthase
MRSPPSELPHRRIDAMGRRTKDSGRYGLIVLDKPAGIGSTDALTKVRNTLEQPRAGHAGTLDPDATGVLLMAFGRCTKLLPYLITASKRYVGEVVLGTETDTLDASGTVTATFDMGATTIEDVRAAATRFLGEITQIPPMVSAIQVDGKRLHEYAREGIEIERKPRAVRIHQLSVTGEVEPGVFAIDVTCGSGTYIRTLAADIGRALGGGAHLRNLRRLSVGLFTIDEAVSLDEIEPSTPLLSPIDMMRGHRHVTVNASMIESIAYGKLLRAVDLAIELGEAGPWVALGEDGRFVSMLEWSKHDGLVKPVAALYVNNGADRLAAKAAAASDASEQAEPLSA